MSLRVGLITLGCKLNQVDTEAIREAFERAGHTVVPFTAEADVYVVNTCTVTGKTDHQSRQMLRRAIKQKETRRCSSQLLPVLATCLEKMRGKLRKGEQKRKTSS